jgi:5-methylcytosine-specific restriction enzyme B
VGQLPLWKVLALALVDSGPTRTAELQEHPLVAAKAALSRGSNFRARMAGNLQLHTKRDCEHVRAKARKEPQIFWKDEDSLWSVDPELLFESVPKLRTAADRPPSWEAGNKRYVFVTFHQSFSYEDFVEGIRPETGEANEIVYRVVPGAFREIAQRALEDPDGRPHAIFIDEINRANIAKVLGELITLLEEDKRIGGDQATTVQLPYSQESFGVPQNLWVIASMNTADRSIAQLDTALRRRFEFRELMPDADVVRDHVGDDGVVEGVDVAQLMETLNDRIEYLYDRDHVLGHSYFLGIETLGDLKRAFLERIVPMLQDYFYDDWEKICLVLGCAGIGFGAARNPKPIVERTALSAVQLFGRDLHLVEERRVRYAVSQAFAKAEDDDELRGYFLNVYRDGSDET